MPDADVETRALIRKLASDPSVVFVDEHAKGNMMAWDITKLDVIDAVCDAIDDGGRLKETVVKTHPPGMVGEPAYGIKSSINKMRFYVRLAVFAPAQGQQDILIISVHPDV